MFGSIDQSEIEIFRRHCGNSPQLLAFVEAHFADEARAHARVLLFESVDESPFSLRQWLESLRNVKAWLDVRGLEMSMDDQLGYVRCACESADAGANLTHLPALVEEMLAIYGCERAMPRTDFDAQE